MGGWLHGSRQGTVGVDVLTSHRKTTLSCHDAFRGSRALQVMLARKAMAPRRPQVSAAVTVKIGLSLMVAARNQSEDSM